MTVEIPLTQGYSALVDDEDAALILTSRWHVQKSARTNYAIGRPEGGQRKRLMHNFLTGWIYVDHINGDGLDNRRANLRPATASQNGGNSRTPTNNTSGFKGVYLHRASGLWHACVKVNRRKVSAGYHHTPQAAARAYDAAALMHFGEFARLNFPQ